jgi:hypothetical protein
MMANITDMFDSISMFIAFENIAFDLLYKAWHSRNEVILECFQRDARLVRVFELILVGCWHLNPAQTSNFSFTNLLTSSFSSFTSVCGVLHAYAPPGRL